MTSVEKILLLMEERNLSCYRVAKDCGFNEAVFTKWKKGIQQPRRDMLMILADYFGVSVDYLLGRETSAATTTATGETSNKAAANVTTAPILNVWAQLDEIQQAKALAYCKTLIAKDNRPKGVVFES